MRSSKTVIAVCGLALTACFPALLLAAQADAEESNKAELKQAFQVKLTGVVFKGTWQMTGAEGLKGRAPLSEPKPDRYEISKVENVGGDHWIITARIVYGDKDVNIPITVRVIWADDLPIITLKPTNLPMLGQYSAQVMVSGNFYSGTWFGTNYGGVLSGQIINAEKAADASTLQGSEKASNTGQEVSE